MSTPSEPLNIDRLLEVARTIKRWPTVAEISELRLGLIDALAVISDLDAENERLRRVIAQASR